MAPLRRSTREGGRSLAGWAQAPDPIDAIADMTPNEHRSAREFRRHADSLRRGPAPLVYRGQVNRPVASRILRRTPRVGHGVLVVGLVWLLGCGDDQPERTGTDGGMTILLPRDALELDPRLTGDAYGLKISRLLFAGLTRVDPVSLEILPYLAERVEILAPDRYRVRLRSGLQFSDGSQLDSADVEATYRSVVSKTLGSRYASTYSRIERVEVTGPLEVTFQLKGPHATFLTDLELPVLRAEDEHSPVAQPGGPAPIGAGPYVLQSRRPGHLVLAANPHWHMGQPRFPKVRLRVIRDDNTRALRLIAGAGDLVLNAMPPLLQPMFEGRPGFLVKAERGLGTTYLGINTGSRVLADERVRRALAHAIDRKRIIATKLAGRAAPATSWVPPGHWAHVEDLPQYEYDPERARSLLADAGYADGLELTLRTGGDRFRRSMARVLAAMLGEVGVRVRIRTTEVASMIADLNRGHFELTLLEFPELLEPHVLSWFFGSDRIPDEHQVGANRWRFANAPLDAALERGRTTTDLVERKRAYRQVQQILARKLPVIPLWHADMVAVSGSRAHSFVVPRNGRFDTLAFP